MKKMVAPKLRFKEFKNLWEKRKLEEVAIIGRGKSKHRPRNASFLYGGKYPFVQTGDVKAADLYLTKYTQTYSEEGLNQSKLWNENTLCITIAANIAETAILKIKACFPDSIIGLVPKENQTSVLFVKYLFDKFKIEIQTLSQGVAQDNLNQEKLSNIEFVFPTLHEQKKITSFLSAVDEKIQQLTHKKELLTEYRKGVMQQLFSGKLRFNDEKGKAFPKWEETKLEDIIERTSTGLNPRKNFLLGKGNNYYVTIKNISNGKLDFSSAERIDDDALDLIKKRSNLRRNDVIMASIGNVGDAYLLSEEPINWNINESVFMIRASKNILHKYLYYIITNDFSKRYFEGNSTGSSFKSIKLRELKLMPVKLPTLIEQKKIADYLSNIDTKLEIVNNQINQTQIFKKGLLQQMFV